MISIPTDPQVRRSCVCDLFLAGYYDYRSDDYDMTNNDDIYNDISFEYGRRKCQLRKIVFSLHNINYVADYW